MTDTNVEIHELNLLHFVLQMIGLAPFSLAKTPEETRLHKLLACYNVCVALLNLGNAYYSQNDERNNFFYSNKTAIIDIAYDAVDVMGSLYASAFILLSLKRYKASAKITYEVKRVTEKFLKLGIHFDHSSTRKTFIAKFIIVFLAFAAFMTITIYLEERVENRYTVLYWLMILHPKLIVSTVILVFGSCSAGVYSKIWAVNEFLRIFMEEYQQKQVLNVKNVSWKPAFINERRLDEFILARQLENETRKRLFHKVRKPTVETTTTEIKKKPLLIFIKNYPKCFEKVNRDIVSEMKTLRQVQFDILELGELIGEHFGSHFLCIFVIYFFGVIINVYSAVTFHVTQVFEEEYVFAVMWASVYLMLILYIVAYCNLAVREADRTIMAVHKFWTIINPSDVLLERELQSFAMQLVNNPLKFTAAGFFTVNSALLFSFVIGVISNVIFIVQFDKLNLQETLRSSAGNASQRLPTGNVGKVTNHALYTKAN